MPRDLEILKPENESWFLGIDGEQRYPICYKYVICYSLREYLKRHDYDRTEGKRILNELREAFRHPNEVFEVADFIDLYPFVDSQGFVVVDQTNGIYPLMLYSGERVADVF